MKGLLIKDFKLMKMQKNFFLLILFVVTAIAWTSDDVSFPIGFLSFVTSLFTVSSISYDEYDNGNAFLFSLPVTRREYVLEKYLFGIILGGGACVIALLLITVLGMLKGTVPSADTLLITGMVFATLLGLLALLLPFQLKFGGEKGRIALIASLAMAFILVSVIVSGLKAVQFDLISNISVMPLHGMGTSAVAIFIFALLLLALSCRISIGIMQKKEF